MIVIGLAFIATLIFTYLEKLILWCSMHTCCRRDKRMYHVVVKNMEAHRKRNLKTSTMFTLAIAFLIFSASSFNLMSKVLTNVLEQRTGADLTAQAQWGLYIDEIPTRDFLQSQMDLPSKPVLDFCFTSQSLQNILGNANIPRLTSNLRPISNFLNAQFSLHAVPENFFDVTGT